MTCAPASTAARICASINSALADRSPMVGSIWQHAILTMLAAYGKRARASWTVCRSRIGPLDISAMVARIPAAQGVTVESPAASRIEKRSIDYVPDDERHGKVSHQGPFWFVGNFQPFTLALGFVGPSLGLSLWWSIVAGIAGIAFGTLFMAFHATQGPVLGLPQMIQSRAQFEHRALGGVERHEQGAE